MPVEEIRSATRFADHVRQFVATIQYRRIETEDDLDLVRRLRYEAYLKEGAISETAEKRMVDRYDDLDNVVNIGLFLDDKLVSALRMHFLSNVNDISPSLDVFPDFLLPLLQAGKKMADPNKFVADHEAARKFPQLAYATTRLTMMAGSYFNAQLAIISPRAEHQAFYQRTFFAKTICPPRAYPALSKPICLMLGDYEADTDKIIQRHPFYASTAAERERLFGKIKIDPKHQSAAAA
ncbi:MAG TPA: hypothetical protein VIJ06_07605 [Methylovirgula sp.]